MPRAVQLDKTDCDCPPEFLSPPVTNLVKSLSVCKIGEYYLPINERTNMRLGELPDLSSDSKIVALKEIRCACVQKQQAPINQLLNRLREYVLAAQNFDHPNVDHVLGLCDGHGPLALLVLPYFSNGDIINYLKRNPGKKDEEKIDLTKGMLAGLAYLHRRGIIHGGVRGGNVLVDDKGVAVLCDAQFDSIVFDDDKYCCLRSDCWWMPRERLIAENDDDNCTLASPSMPADIYGAALVTEQMWTLRRPFYRMRNEYELVMTFRKLEVDKPAQVDRSEGSIPVPVWALLEDCLMTNPQERPTAEGLLVSFEDLSLD